MKSHLTNIPETMLWTLQNRAVEAMRSDGIINDDKAVEIYSSINYDYERNFGKAEPSHAMRSNVFDKEINEFLSKHPNGTIVNLGEGLETQRFRVNDNQALWLTVDLPEAIEIREHFMKQDERHIHIALSATDTNWFDLVPKNEPVFITAQGLFMYFTQDEVRSLIQEIANEFDHCYLMFDTISKLLSNKTISTNGWNKTKNYKTPKMPWGINRNEIISTIKGWLFKDIKVEDLGYPDFPRGAMKCATILLNLIPVTRNIFPTIVKISF